MTKLLFVTALICMYGLLSMNATKDDLQDSIKRGEQVYLTNCMSCHMMNGEGVSGVYPPLVKIDSLLKDVPVNINVVLKGQNGEVMVAGQQYNTDMPSQNYLTDEQIADVLNYVRNSWGNKGEIVTPDMVKTERDKM